MRYNSFLKENKDVTMVGTKRYDDKSGEYYLLNSEKLHKKNSNFLLQKYNTKPNLTNNNNKNLIRVNKKKTYDELVPLPKVKQKNKIKCEYDEKNLNNAINNAKYIRRYQYSKNLITKQNKINEDAKKNEIIFLLKVKFLQIWWKTIFQIIKIQKNIRRFLYKIKKEKLSIFIRHIKSIFCHKYMTKLITNKPGIKYYFNKWYFITFKKIIIKRIINMKNLNPDRNRSEKNIEYIKNCIIDSSYNITFNKNSSMQSLPLKIERNRLTLGLEAFSSNIFTEQKENKYLGKVNKNNKSIRLLYKNKYKNDYNTNKNNINKSKKIQLDNKPLFNTKINKNIKHRNETNFKNSELYPKEKNKNNNTTSNINKNHSNQNHLNKIKVSDKSKKNKVYENEIFLYYNQYQTLETNNSNNLISLNKDLQEHYEIGLNESQFSNHLDNFTIKENEDINKFYNISNKNKAIIKEFNLENDKDNQKRILLLKKYFEKWTKLYIINIFLKKLSINKKMNNGINILNKVYYKNISKEFFINMKKTYDNNILFEEFIELFDNMKKKLLVKYIKSFRNKYSLQKYFNIYKNEIYNKIILEKLKEYQKIKIIEEQNKFEPSKSYDLNEQFMKTIHIDTNFIQSKFNLNNKQSNNCFIINNLNYNNNTNNIDIKLSYDLNNRKNNINFGNIKSKVDLTKKKHNKKKIGVYKRNKIKVFPDFNSNFTDYNNDKNFSTSLNFYTKHNPNFSELNREFCFNPVKIIPEININRSYNLQMNSSQSSQLNSDIITKINQLVMVINILERHNRLKISNLYYKSFEMWKNLLNGGSVSFYEPKNKLVKKYINLGKIKNIINKNQSIIIGEERYIPNTSEKIINISKDNENNRRRIKLEKNNLCKKNENLNLKSLKIIKFDSKINKSQNQIYNYNTSDSLEIKFNNLNKQTVYKKKSIFGASNFTKKNENTKIKYQSTFDNEKIIYNKPERLSYGFLSPENYCGIKKIDKIEEMVISFGNSKINQNNTIPIQFNKNKKRKYDNIKYIKQFIIENKKENNNKKKKKNEIKDLIKEDIEENKEYDINNTNIITNLKYYFKEDIKQINYNTNTFNDYFSDSNDKLNEKFCIKKYKSNKNIF